MSQQAVLQVVILRDGLLVGTEVFVPGSYSLGSGPEADLKLEDPTVSGQHAVLYFQNNRAAIQDAGSSTGVYVNGHKISACEIRAVDEVLVGPFVLKVRVLEKKQQPQKPQPPPEVAAVLKGGAPAAPSRPPARAPLAPTPVGMANTVPSAGPVPSSARPPMEATVASARRLQAVPQAEVAPAQPQQPARPAPHLRPVPKPFEEERATESVVIPDSVFGETNTDITAPGGRPPPTRRARPAQERPAQAQRKESLRDLNWASSGAPKLSAEQLASKKAPKLYLELYWGETRRETRAFNLDKKGISAAADELAQMPLWGFTLPDDFVLAEPAGQSFRVFVPPYSVVERASTGESFMPAEAEGRGSGKFVTLSIGQAARFSEGEMSLVAYVAPPPQKEWVNPLKGLPWLALFFFFLFGGAWVWFLIYGPKPADLPDFQSKNLPPVAVRLIAPEKKEAAKKELEKIQKKVAEKAEKKPAADKKIEKAEKKIVEKLPPPVQQAPEAKALKALAKLSAAGPMKDLLAATDKLGNGPGDKRIKNSDYKLSGLMGKQPIANAGVGLFGLGGGGKGGGSTLGIEQLRGKGGGGIGALGAGKVGKGSVGGVVTRATARSIGVQGSIDREAVAKTVNSHLQEVRACYERALLKEPSLAGKVVLEWTISTAGSVVTARTKTSTLRNQAVESCILQNLKSWRFPPAKGGQVIVSYPFLFNSVGY